MKLLARIGAPFAWKVVRQHDGYAQWRKLALVLGSPVAMSAHRGSVRWCGADAGGGCVGLVRSSRGLRMCHSASRRRSQREPSTQWP
jgi:hypothetical protein